MPSSSPSWSDSMRAQYGPDPSLFAVPASDTPGFHKSPAILEALAAADPRPPGFYRSPALLGASATAQSLDPSLPPTIGPQEMLFGGPGLPADTNVPLLSNLPSLAQSMARLSTLPGFYKSPALMGSGTPTPSLDPSLTPAIGSQMMLLGGPGLPSRSNGPAVSPGLIPTGFSTPFPPPMTGPQATFPAGGPSFILAQASPPTGSQPALPPLPQSSIADDPAKSTGPTGHANGGLPGAGYDQTPHHYEFSVPLCIGCSPSAALDAMRSFSAPGAPYAQNGTHDVILSGNNPIRQTVDPETLTIINTTLPGHTFHPGTVKLSIVQGPGGVVSLHVVGDGTGPRPTENEILGHLIFLKSGLEAFGRLNPNFGTVP